jgi:phospholipase C
VNGYTSTLLNNNPNLNPANGTGATNPFRLDRLQAVTRDQSHGYTAEQQAFNSGVMDLFPLFVGRAGPPPSGGGITSTTGLNLGYFDGNTVTTMWYLAQYFAMSDNSDSTGFGPSTPGALNLISGQTNGATATAAASFAIVAGGAGSSTVISDADPTGDVCSSKTTNLTMSGQNIGNLLSAAGISWGGFMGGFNLDVTNPNGTTGCARSTQGLSGTTADYSSSPQLVPVLQLHLESQPHKARFNCGNWPRWTGQTTNTTWRIFLPRLEQEISPPSAS